MVKEGDLILVISCPERLDPGLAADVMGVMLFFVDWGGRSGQQHRL